MSPIASVQQRFIEQRNTALARHLAALGNMVEPRTLRQEGSLVRMVGIKLEAVGFQAPIGSRCRIMAEHGEAVEAEVVGFADGSLYLMPEGRLQGVQLGARVVPMDTASVVAVDEQLLGRVIDGAGETIDGGPRLRCLHHMPLRGGSINPLQRQPISAPLDVGIRAINGLLSIGKGQRLGLFAGSGVGKSTLLGMMTRHTAADVIVVALVGERGREVREFVDEILGPAGLKKAIVVATPADDPPLMRVHGAWRATAVAEYFRSRGKDVLLLMDSLTRFAQAQREIGLAVGEPPVSKGYPPSVFSLLPTLAERAGNGSGSEGSITAIYTVLVEGDDHSDPVADAARAILDGHIVLSREMADSGIYPAIDAEASISRSMVGIVDSRQLAQAKLVKSLYAGYRENRDLVNIGAYKPGSDARIDIAIQAAPLIQAYITQNQVNRIGWQASVTELEQLTASVGVVVEEDES